MSTPHRLTGLSAIAARYDAVLCDVWGVLHNGVAAHHGVVDALRRFQDHGPVVLVTNAPRPSGPIVQQLAELGIPRDAYTDIVSSGDVVRAHLINTNAQRAYHIGPERDLPIYEGTEVVLVDHPAEAEAIVIAGMRDDDNEKVEEYREELTAVRDSARPVICANPDIIVERGGELIPCAGALAQLLEQLGGTVEHLGKPWPPIYARAIAAANAATDGVSRVLSIGDAFATDIIGANQNSFDALLITGGIHAAEFGHVAEPDAALVAGRLASESLEAHYFAPRLVW